MYSVREPQYTCSPYTLSAKFVPDSIGIRPGWGAYRAHPPNRYAGAGQEGRRGATPRAVCRAHVAPNNALEPTANSLRSSVAPAIGGGSPRALGAAPGGNPSRLAGGTVRRSDSLVAVPLDAGGSRGPNRLAYRVGVGHWMAHRARRLRRRRIPGAGGTSSGTRQRAHAPHPGRAGVRKGGGVPTRHTLHGPRWGHGRPSATRVACRRLVGGIRLCHPGSGRRVAVRPLARLRGRAGGAVGHGAERRPQRATPARCAGRVAQTPVKRWSRPPWSWWGARTSLHRGVDILPGRAAHGARDTVAQALPGPPAWVWGHTALRPRAGAQEQVKKADGGPPRGRCVVPMRPLTTPWSRRPTAFAPASLRLLGAAQRER